MDISLPDDKIRYLEGQTLSLQTQLAERSETTVSISNKNERLEKSLDEINQTIDKERTLTCNLTRDMTRQYKGMQDELLNKINQREHEIQQLREEIQQEKIGKKKVVGEKDGVIRRKDEIIEKLKNQIEEQCMLFTKMLNDALEQMKDKVELHNSSYEEESIPIHQRLEEFKFHTGVMS